MPLKLNLQHGTWSQRAVVHTPDTCWAIRIQIFTIIYIVSIVNDQNYIIKILQ